MDQQLLQALEMTFAPSTQDIKAATDFLARLET
jgi:hypothetical protein